MTVNSVGVVSHTPQKRKNSNNGKLIGGLAGTTTAAAVATKCVLTELKPQEIAYEAGKACNLTNHFNHSSHIFKEILNNESSKKDFIRNASKIIQKNAYLGIGFFSVALVSAGVLVGAVADAIANRKANKVPDAKLDIKS